MHDRLDSLRESLTTPVIVDQRPLGGNARSTVGTISDIYSMIRVLFARHGEPSLGQPSAYSFNDPKGMNPAALSTRIDGRNIADWCRLQISDLIELLATIEDQRPTAMVGAIRNALERIAAIIDLGPDGGRNGGEIMFTGRPEKLLAAERSLTAEYLRRHQSA